MGISNDKPKQTTNKFSKYPTPDWERAPTPTELKKNCLYPNSFTENNPYPTISNKSSSNNLNISDNPYEKYKETKNTDSILKEGKIQLTPKFLGDSYDKTLKKLKEKEKKDLTGFFKENKKEYYYYLAQYGKEKIVQIKHDNLLKDAIEKENIKEIFKSQIQKEIDIIKEGDSHDIKYLTVLLVGISGVGKSTLINSILQIEEEEKKAKEGVGSFITEKTQIYESQKVPYLRLVDTRGIEHDPEYGVQKTQKETESFIKEQLKTNDPNKFVHCIWYCITGNRFEEVEINVLNILRNSYKEHDIPIIIVYTKAINEIAIKDMQKYINEKNIKAEFIKVLAREKRDFQGQIHKAFGLEELLKNTLDKCKEALDGQMFKIVTNSLSNLLIETLNKKNNNNKEKVIKNALEEVKHFSNILEDNQFINLIIDIFRYNIYYKEQSKYKDEVIEIYMESNIIKFVQDFINIYKKKTKEIVNKNKNQIALTFLDYQAILEMETENDDIKYGNKRNLEGFKKTTEIFLNDNFYFLAQKLLIKLVHENYFKSFCNLLLEQYNIIVKNLMENNDIKKNIEKCIQGKFEKFRIILSKNIFKTKNNNRNTISGNNNFISNNEDDLNSLFLDSECNKNDENKNNINEVNSNNDSSNNKDCNRNEINNNYNIENNTNINIINNNNYNIINNNINLNNNLINNNNNIFIQNDHIQNNNYSQYNFNNNNNSENNINNEDNNQNFSDIQTNLFSSQDSSLRRLDFNLNFSKTYSTKFNQKLIN